MAPLTPCANLRYALESHPIWVQSNTEYFCSSLRNRMAASAGDKVSALNSDMAIENAIVSENCLYRIPVVPGKNDTGTNTEISTSDVATTALDTSAMATDVAPCGSVPSRFIWRCAFSMTTIASSTTSPVAKVIPKSVRELIEKSKILMKAKVPMSDTGMVTAVQQKQEDHNDDDEDRFFQRRYHFSHRVTDDGRRIEGDHILNSGRERLG